MIESTRTPDGLDILRVIGEASVGEVQVLERAITRTIAGLPERLILDLTGLAFASSLAIGQLMALLHTARSKHRQVVVVCVEHGDIHGVLTRSRAHSLAPIVHSIGAAVDRLTGVEPG